LSFLGVRFLILSRGVKRRISRCAERSISHGAKRHISRRAEPGISRAKRAYHAPQAQFMPQGNSCNAVAIHARSAIHAGAACNSFNIGAANILWPHPALADVKSVGDCPPSPPGEGKRKCSFRMRKPILYLLSLMRTCGAGSQWQPLQYK